MYDDCLQFMTTHDSLLLEESLQRGWSGLVWCC